MSKLLFWFWVVVWGPGKGVGVWRRRRRAHTPVPMGAGREKADQAERTGYPWRSWGRRPVLVVWGGGWGCSKGGGMSFVSRVRLDAADGAHPAPLFPPPLALALPEHNTHPYARPLDGARGGAWRGADRRQQHRQGRARPHGGKGGCLPRRAEMSERGAGKEEEEGSFSRARARVWSSRARQRMEGGGPDGCESSARCGRGARAGSGVVWRGAMRERRARLNTAARRRPPKATELLLLLEPLQTSRALFCLQV